MSQILSALDASRSWFQHLGWIGVLLLALMLALSQIAIVPVSPLSIASGIFFGFIGGLVATVLGTTLGMTLNFLLARYVARDAVTRRLARNERFRQIDAAIGREGWKIVALLRFVPMPFGLANYAYGLTAIAFPAYLLASVVAILPGNIFFVWLGSSTGASLQALAGGGRPRQPFEYVLMGASLLCFFAALTYIGKIARQAVAESGAKA